AAFYTALLNNQPMGFYHPSTLVKDAQRRGVRFQPIDVQISDWDCTVEADGSIRLGLRYVSGLRQEIGRRIADARLRRPVLDTREGYGPSASARGGGAPRDSKQCPKCGCDDESMLEVTDGRLFCNVCSYLEPERSAKAVALHERSPALHERSPALHGCGAKALAERKRFASLDDLIARTGLRRDEVVTLADIGALNAFGYDRRSALWQAERAVRPAGELFTTINTEGAEDTEGTEYIFYDEYENVRRPVLDTREDDGPSASGTLEGEAQRRPVLDTREDDGPSASAHGGGAPCEIKDVAPDPSYCPLKPMTEAERLVADYAGMGLTVGPHPMALRRDELAMRGVLRAVDLRTTRQGRRVRVAGMVITRQRPGTAKGFVFLTLEDETGIANIIVRPD